MSKSELQTSKYWDERYSKGNEDFDWFKSFSEVRDLICPLLDINDRIIVLGCGNSTLSADLYEEGYSKITNVDFSSTCIDQMQDKHKDKQMSWLVRDVRDLHGLEKFDKCLDKGTFDALLSRDGSPWDLPDDVKASAQAYMNEVARILVPHGQFVWITFTQPHFSKPLLAHSQLKDLRIQPIGSSGLLQYFRITLTKA